MKNSLEDFMGDVIRKAQKGLGITDQELFSYAGGTGESVESIQDPLQKVQVVRKIAQKLSLKPEALLQLAAKKPRPFALVPANITVFRTPFKKDDVNSFLLIDEESREAAAFDTGTDASPLLAKITQQKVSLKYLFLTHAHRDHVSETNRIVESTGAEVWIGDQEPEMGVNRFSAGDSFQVGHYLVETRLTSGHTRGGITYWIQGTVPPIAFVGDALFASSMGGTSTSYREAIQTNHEQIYSLPKETLLFPGHGPVTSVGLEKKYNPFYLGE
jgi:glyoxylase-like metal-dependent hydrolase (beta-lactamase superfamily II)